MALWGRKQQEQPDPAPAPVGEVWTAGPAGPDALAIEVTRDELGEIEELLRDAWSCEQRRRSTPTPAAESPVPAMVKAWNMRAGAAVAAAERGGHEPRGVPFFENEIETVEHAVKVVETDAFSSIGRSSYGGLLKRLHSRLGYAQAVNYLDGRLPVFRHQLEPPADGR